MWIVIYRTKTNEGRVRVFKAFSDSPAKVVAWLIKCLDARDLALASIDGVYRVNLTCDKTDIADWVENYSRYV